MLYVSQLRLNCIFSMFTLNMFTLKGSCFEDWSHWTGWNWKKDIISESVWLEFLRRSYYCRFPSLTYNFFDKKLSHFQYTLSHYWECVKIHNKCYQCCCPCVYSFYFSRQWTWSKITALLILPSNTIFPYWVSQVFNRTTFSTGSSSPKSLSEE